MRLPRYLAYRCSDVEWIGAIPSHWQTASVKHRFQVVGGSTPKSDVSAYWDGGITWVSPADLSQLSSMYLDSSARTITAAGLESCGTTLVPPGSIVLSTRAPIGSLGIARVALCTNQGCKSLVPSSSVDSGFYAYVLSAATEELNVRGKGTTFLELSADELAAFKVPVPELSEQRAISAFLDRETAKIDALIAEQEKLISLLAEKRQATISHAVTRGLDPDVPMKDSPVEWLGRIPAHWSIRRLKRISPFITVGIVVNPSEYISEDGLPFIYGGDIGEGHIDIGQCRRISPFNSARQPKTQLRAGDLLTVRVGAPGVTAVVPESCAGGNCASVMLIRAGDFDSDWLCYAMNSRIVRYQVEVVQYGAAQEQFNISHAVDFSVPTPPVPEQAAISRHLNDEVLRIDGLVHASRQAIALLQERRSALISAAVTGQIDVRNTEAREAR